MNRKEFLFTTLGLGTMISASSSGFIPSLQNPVKSLDMLDHLLLGVSNLEEGIKLVREKTGIEAAMGGKHPNIGTHNALLSLGNNRYLEIIAPAPGEKLIDHYAFLKDLKNPEIFTWAAHTNDIGSVDKQVTAAGYESSGISDGSRITKEGKKLSWKGLSFATPGEMLVPFFIEWGKDTTHPSVTSPKGCELNSFDIFHPKPKELETVFKNIGMNLTVRESATPSLKMTIKTPKGLVTF